MFAFAIVLLFCLLLTVQLILNISSNTFSASNNIDVEAANVANVYPSLCFDLDHYLIL